MKDFCKYCFNDPVIYNCQKELCGTCEMETKAAKRKMTNAGRIRAMTDEELAKFFADNLCELFCNGGVSSCNADCYIHALKWLKQEVAE